MGVRLYYGVYKNNLEYAGLHTIFIIPTYSGVDFDPTISTAKKKVVTLVDLAKNPKQEADILNNGGLCPPQCPPKPLNYKTTNYKHTIQEFLDVTREYRDKRWNLINQTAGIEDARSIWFSLDGLKSFINTIEKNSASLNIPSKDLGVNMYYAVYKNNPEYKGLHTIFMAPTYKNNNGEQIDFDPLISVAKKKIVTFEELTKTLNTDAYVWNNGSLCPPQCPPKNNSSPTNGTMRLIDSDR